MLGVEGKLAAPVGLAGGGVGRAVLVRPGAGRGAGARRETGAAVLRDSTSSGGWAPSSRLVAGFALSWRGKRARQDGFSAPRSWLMRLAMRESLCPASPTAISAASVVGFARGSDGMSNFITTKFTNRTSSQYGASAFAPRA